jgi:hypothetical protein
MANATVEELDAVAAAAKVEAEAAAKLGTEGKTAAATAKSEAVTAQSTANKPLETGAGELFTANVASAAANEAARKAELEHSNP